MSILESGAPAPGFRVRDPLGREQDLASFRGGSLLLVFDPVSVDAGRGLLVALQGARLGPDGDPPAPGDPAASPLALCDDAEVARAYGVGSEPAAFLIDGDGVVRWAHAGAWPPQDLAGGPPPGAPAGPSRRELLVAAWLAAVLALLASQVPAARTAGDSRPGSQSRD